MSLDGIQKPGVNGVGAASFAGSTATSQILQFVPAKGTPASPASLLSGLPSTFRSPTSASVWQSLEQIENPQAKRL